MKPVCKKVSSETYSPYGKAKSALMEQLGPHCSYCEAYGRPTNLHVEHIYPKNAHRSRETLWDNFLLACGSCNSKKNSNLGSGRQRALLARFLWPHIDNTGNAFLYLSDGRVVPSPNLPHRIQKLAEDTIAMLGVMTSPSKAKSFRSRAISYSAASTRNERWGEAISTRADYLREPTIARARFFAKLAATIGHFSVWMEVFHDRPEFRNELISAFKADGACYDKRARPIRKGRA